jgi:hypothetical protein
MNINYLLFCGLNTRESLAVTAPISLSISSAKVATITAMDCSPLNVVSFVLPVNRYLK